MRPLPPLWYQSHSFLAGDSVVVFSVSLSVSTRNFDTPLLCPLLIIIGATLVVKLTGHKQASQLPQIIQTAIKGFESSSTRPFVSIRCWVLCQYGKEIIG